MYLGLDATVMSFINDDGPSRIKSCTICGYTTGHMKDLKRHIESKHMRLTICCKFCESVNKTRRTLEYHLKKYHADMIIQKDILTIVDWHVEDIKSEEIEIFVNKQPRSH